MASRLLVMSFKLPGMDVKFYTVKLKHSTGAKRMKSTVWARRGLAEQCCTVTSKANHYSKNLQAALGSGKEMATIRAFSVFTTDPLLLTCWHHHETPFPLIYTVTHTFSWPLGLRKKSVELSAKGGSLNLEAITICPALAVAAISGIHYTYLPVWQKQKTMWGECRLIFPK